MAKTEQGLKADFGGAMNCPQAGAGSSLHSTCSLELTTGTCCPRKLHVLVSESPRPLLPCRDIQLQESGTEETWWQLGCGASSAGEEVMRSASSRTVAGLSLVWLFHMGLEKCRE